MKFVEPSRFTDPDVAARKLLPDDALKIVLRGADKEDRAAVLS
jgi:hypothetical protein